VLQRDVTTSALSSVVDEVPVVVAVVGLLIDDPVVDEVLTVVDSPVVAEVLAVVGGPVVDETAPVLSSVVDLLTTSVAEFILGGAFDMAVEEVSQSEIAQVVAAGCALATIIEGFVQAVTPAA